MLPELGIGLVAGFVLGWAIAWVLGRSRHQMESQRAAQIEQQLAERVASLESAQRERDSSRHELAAQQQAGTERDAKQREEIARITAERGNFERNAEQAANALEEQRSENTHLRNQLLESETERASLKTALEAEHGNHAQKLATLTDQFKVLAGEILKENSKTFTEQNQTSIGNLLNPLKEKFGEFQQKVESLEKDGLTGRTELKTQIESLSKLNERLSQDANNLVTALKGSSQQQGQWGEQLLESILEEAGLRKGHQYFTQESFSRDEPSANGRNRARLDVLVKLPEGRDLILDSKVSLTAYNDYCAAQDDAVREAALGRHLASVRGHIRGLSAQEYHLLDGVNSPDFVFMFVPLEPAFMLAISGDSKLLQEAWDKNILLVGPSTVLYVLRIVAQIWRQEQQKKEVDEVYRRGAELYNKLADFAADLMEVGKNLDKARDSYDEAVKKLSTGRGNAIRRAEMLKNLGVKPSKAIPMALVDHAFDDVPLELAAGADDGEV